MKPWLQKNNRIIYNPHFWIIILIILCLTIFYYEPFILGSRTPTFFWYLKLFEFNRNLQGSLFCVPMVYAALIFWWRGALIMGLLSIIIMLPQMLHYKPQLVSSLANIFYLLIPLMIVGYISLEISWRSRERKVIGEREVERQSYVAQVFKAQEDERKRIAQEIHDDSLQKLAVIASMAQLLASDGHLGSFPIVKKRAESIRDLIISVSKDLRRLSIDLRPTVLDDLGLVPSLRWLVDSFKEESGIHAEIEVIGENSQLSKKTTINIFRIVQEALNNVRQHSEATNVIVTLQFTDRTIKVTIQDNGKGFSLPRTYDKLSSNGKLGVIGMQQRAQFLNGTFNIKSEIDNGTTISVETCL